MDHTEIAKNLWEQLPLVKFIVEEFSNSWVYGGFMRWLITFIEEEKRTPTIHDTSAYLIHSDIDIRIQIESGVTSFAGPSGYKVACERIHLNLSESVKKIFNKVLTMGGKMEYAGFSYREHDIPQHYEKYKDICMEDENPVYYMGNYVVWLPIGDDTYHRYDISFYRGIEGYMTDYIVNNIQYNELKGVVYNKTENIEVVLPHIRDHIMDIPHVFGIKKIYRGHKLWGKGYKFPENDKSAVFLYNKLDDIFSSPKSKWRGFYICVNDMKKPSVECLDKNIIPITKHTATFVTREMFLENPFVKHVLATYANPNCNTTTKVSVQYMQGFKEKCICHDCEKNYTLCSKCGDRFCCDIMGYTGVMNECYICKYTKQTQSLHIVTEQYRTEKICKFALEGMGSDLKFVPEQHKTLEMCEIAVRQNGNALRYVPEQHKTLEICKLAVQKDAYAIEFVLEQHKTLEMCKLAVQKDAYAIEFVPEQHKTLEMCKLAVQQNGNAIEFVPEQHKTLEMCEIAVRQDGRTLKYVPEQHKTLEMCEIAVRKNRSAF
jgi:hypothetical protein